MRLKILRIAMDGEEFPHFTMADAFRNQFDVLATIWWEKYSHGDLNTHIQEFVMEHKPDAVFMQIQRGGVITPLTAKVISDNSIGFNWTGDVRENIDWYIELGKQKIVTLFTNMHDVKRMHQLGLQADYLQIGYDHNYYYPDANKPKYNNIVFCGNFYPEHHFPLTPMRVEAVQGLKMNFGEGFNLYGGANWKSIQLHPECIADNTGEADVYHRCAIAISISHFDYSRYYSDRLLRELACGAFVLSHRFQDCELEFKAGEHLDYFDTVTEMISKCQYYMQHPELRERIGAQAAAYVAENCRWEHRAKEFEALIIKYKQLENE